MAYLLLYVDDIILIVSSDKLCQSIISRLSSEFAMKDLGHLSYFMGIIVDCHACCLFLSQQKYVDEIIGRADLSSCKPSPTPVDTKMKLNATTSKSFEDPSLYRSPSGALQYLTFMRTDITYVVQQVCLFIHDPREEHMMLLRTFCATYKVLWILVFTFIHLPHPHLFHILMLIGVDALIHDVQYRVTVSFWVIT